MAKRKAKTKMTNESGIVGDGQARPKAPTVEEVFNDPAKYAGTQYDPVMQPVTLQTIIGPGGFIADHAEGDFWNPMHEPFHESDNNVSAPTRGGQSGFEWRDFYKGNANGNASKSALHWLRLDLIKRGMADPGADGMQEFLKKLALSQKRELGIL